MTKKYIDIILKSAPMRAYEAAKLYEAKNPTCTEIELNAYYDNYIAGYIEGSIKTLYLLNVSPDDEQKVENNEKQGSNK